MKKNVGKKIRLMALLASLTLVLWGGVIACSNGSDDTGDDKISVKLKGTFFEEGDDNTPWEYCTEELTETESGIWEGEITSVNSKGWDKFGVEVTKNGTTTWYGAEDGLKEVKDAKFVKDSDKNFWLATEKGGKTKVTIDLNKMTITAVDANQTKPTPDEGNGEEETPGGETVKPGDDNDGEKTPSETVKTSVKLKGAFFEEGGDDTPWVYCEEQLTETESGIWEAEITSVNSNGWDSFGIEVNGTWYGAEDGLTEVKDAKLVKDGSKNFWLATGKGGKTKVTVNLNKMTITVIDANPTESGTGGETPTPDKDDDGDEEEKAPPVVTTSVKLKGAFFEEGDDDTPWVYCSEQFTETESGIWEAEITSVNSNGWDSFGIEVNGTWYGAEDGLTEVKDAKLVKDGSKNFWLATGKGGKTKVTVNLNKMTITATES